MPPPFRGSEWTPVWWGGQSALSARGAHLLLVLTALLAAASGCSAGRVNVWPIYFRESRRIGIEPDREVVSTTDVLYPFYTSETTSQGYWHALRPLYNYERRRSTGDWRIQYLWPLGLHGKRANGESYSRLLPVFSHNRTWSRNEQEFSVHDFVLFLIWWGRQAEQGAYFAVFPLGGVTHGVLGRTWGWALFPLYSQYRRADFTRHDFPWPVLGYGGSPDGRQRMLRLWPLYVYQSYADDFVKRSRTDVLWPLLRWGQEDKGGRHYFRMFQFFPLCSQVGTYDRSHNKTAARTEILGVGWWPGGWSALWGLIRFSTRPTDETRLFPLYWRSTHYGGTGRDPRRRADQYRVLWPIVWYSVNQATGRERQTVFVVAPLYWDYGKAALAEDGSAMARRRHITLFPLATWGRDEDGSRHFWIPSHGWTDLSKGFKRNYRAFFDLVQYHQGSGLDERETRLLSRLYHHRRSPRGRYLSLACLFTYDSMGDVVGEDGKYVELLFGLIRRSWNERQGRWRILYIPFGGPD